MYVLQCTKYSRLWFINSAHKSAPTVYEAVWNEQRDCACQMADIEQ